MTGKRYLLGKVALPGVAFAVCLGAILHQGLSHYLFAPPSYKVLVTPDDGFYYLILARRFAATGRWSFDGVSPTTGFHPLHAYISAAIYRLFPTLGEDTALVLHACVGMILTAAAMWILIRTIDQTFRGLATLGVTLVATSANFVVQPLMVMEWPWV